MLRSHLPRSCLLACLLGLLAPGCGGFFIYDDVAGPVTLLGLGAADCPDDWSGSSLDATTQAALEGTLELLIADMRIQIDSEIARINALAADSIELDSLSLQLKMPPAGLTNQNSFGFLTAIEVWVDSSQPDSRLEAQLLGSIDLVPEAATILPLATTDVDLKPYLSEGLAVTIEASTRSCLQVDLEVSMAYAALVRSSE